VRCGGRTAWALALVLAPAGCIATGATGGSGSPTIAATLASDSVPATASQAGTLRQESIALQLQLRGVTVRLFPIDPWVTDLLAPDSRRTMNGFITANRERLETARLQHGEDRLSVWYVTFYAVEPDVRFSASEVGITSAGRTFQPLEVFPLSAGFNEQRLSQGQSQSALYLFSGDVIISQPLEVSVAGIRNSEWESVLRTLDRERARARTTRVDTLTGWSVN